MGERSRDAARNESQASESLAQDVEAAEAAVQPAQDEELESMEEPRKQHGDALLDGSGTRHGVHDARTRPNL